MAYKVLFYVLLPLYTLSTLVLGVTITAGIFIFHVVVVPLLFKFSKSFRQHIVFANFVQWPLHTDFENPSASGVIGGRNLYLEHDSKVDKCHVKLGLWHILPTSSYERLKETIDNINDKEELNRLLDNELAHSTRPIILYCHGNSNSRAAFHRLQLYKFFQKMDFHTIAFDYRGYGDSTDVTPSEAGVVEDALAVFSWLHAMGDGKPPVFVWGHSLGTGISSHLLGNLSVLSETTLERRTPLPLPKGLILEAPFCSLEDEVRCMPLSKLVNWLPYYDCTFLSPFRDPANQTFTSHVYLRQLRTLPVLIIHAEDDLIVTYKTGRHLFKAIQDSRSECDAPVRMHSFARALRLGHKWICTAPELPDIVTEFVTSHQ